MDQISNGVTLFGVVTFITLLGNLRCESDLESWARSKPYVDKLNMVAELEMQVQNLKALVHELKGDISYLSSDNTQKIQELPRQIRQLQNPIHVSKKQSPIELLLGPRYMPGHQPNREVGFHVNLAKSSEVTAGGVLPFDHVVTNIGGAFNVNTGIFTCPASGTYLFSLAVVCDVYSFMHLSIIKDGSPVFNSLCDNRNGSSWHQGGGTVILMLQYGDELWVGKTWPHGTSMAYGNGMTSFSGYLLN